MKIKHEHIRMAMNAWAVETRERLVRDADDFVAVAIAGFNQMNRGGPAGNTLAVH